MNPEGFMLSLGGYHIWPGEMDRELNVPSSYMRTGFTVATSPAFGKAGLHAEWSPVVFAKLRLEYDGYRYYGMNTALLSFPSGDAPFGRDEVNALEGQEETGYGERVLIRPTLYGKLGPVIISNETDFAYFRVSGQGPFFLDWEYETLVKHRDRVVNNRTNALIKAWQGPKEAVFLAGPYYEHTRAAGAGLTRQRVGGVLYFVPKDAAGPFDRPRLYSQFGNYIQDRNREGEWYFAIGMGFDYDL